MKEIVLTRGQVTIVDTEDYDYLIKHKWFACPIPGYGYSVMRSTDNKYMSRIIMKCPPTFVVDHINRNTLDNRKANLRICTQAENCRNKSGWKTKSSKYKGVYKISSIKWVSKIGINGLIKHLGTFNNEKEAALAYNKAAARLHGEFARLNEVD